jgi:hypothetical protein
MGTLGAARYLADNIPEIYETVKNRRWSTLVEVRYNPEKRTVVSTKRISPIYH